MAETEFKPKAVTYKEVGSAAVWKEIGIVTGAGNIAPGPNGDRSITIQDAATAKKVDALIAKSKEKEK